MNDFFGLRDSLRAMLAQTNADIRAQKAEIQAINRSGGSTPWPGFLKARASLLHATLSHLRGRTHMKRWHTYGGGCTLCHAREITDAASQARFITAFLDHRCLGNSQFFLASEAALLRRARVMREAFLAALPKTEDAPIMTLT